MKTKILNIRKGDFLYHKIDKDRIWIGTFAGFIFENMREINLKEKKIRKRGMGGKESITNIDEGKSYSLNIPNKKEIKDILEIEKEIKVLEAL